MKKETKEVILDSLAEAVKYITAGLFAGLLVVFLTGQPVIDMSKPLSYLIVPILYIFMLIVTWIVLIPLNLGKIKTKKD